MTADALVHLCDACGEPVWPGRGYLHLSHAAADARRRADREQRRIAQLRRMPGVIAPADVPEVPLARWQIHHRSCDPNPSRADYFVDVGRIGSHAALLDLTADLLPKRWLRDTAWPDFLRSTLTRGVKS